MNFANPLLLAIGIGCVALPILAHLQRRRQPKRVVFSTLRLMEASLRTSRSRQRITDWPLFLLRLLAVLALALVFSKVSVPGLDGQGANQRETIAMVFDRSASMAARGAAGSALDEAKDSARLALEETADSSLVHLIESPPTTPDAPTSWLRPNDLMGPINRIESSFQQGDLAQALRKAADSLSSFGSELPKVIHLISDLQLSEIENFDDLEFPPDVTIRVSKVGDLNPSNAGFIVGARGRDVLRSGLYTYRSGMNGTLTVEDRAWGSESKRKPPASRTVPLPGANRPVVVPYNAQAQFGWFARTLSTDRSDSWDADNTAYDAFYIQRPIAAVLIEPEPMLESFLRRTFFIEKALAPDRFEEEIALRFELQTTAPTDLAEALSPRGNQPPPELVIVPDLPEVTPEVASALRAYVFQGGAALFYGGPDLNPQAYRDDFGALLPVILEGATELTDPEPLQFVTSRHPLWGDLDTTLRRNLRRLRLTHRHQLALRDLPPEAVLASFDDGVPLIVEHAYGDGRVAFINATADRRWGTWQTEGILFVVTTHLMASRLADREDDAYRNARVSAVVGEALTVALGPGFADRWVRFDGAEIAVDGEGRVAIQAPSTPGHYRLEDPDGSILRALAVNLPPAESELESLQSIVVQRQLEGRRLSVDDEDPSALGKAPSEFGRILWRSLLALLAVALAAETLLSNRYSLRSSAGTAGEASSQ